MTASIGGDDDEKRESRALWSFKFRRVNVDGSVSGGKWEGRGRMSRAWTV